MESIEKVHEVVRKALLKYHDDPQAVDAYDRLTIWISHFRSVAEKRAVERQAA